MIRRFEPADLPQVMDIWLRGNYEAHSFVPASFWDERFDEVADAISSAEVYVYDDGEILGFIGLQGDYIAGLFVRAEKRGRGIGTALLNFVGDRELSAHVFGKNEKALEFYLRNEFSVISQSVNKETGESELFLKR